MSNYPHSKDRAKNSIRVFLLASVLIPILAIMAGAQDPIIRCDLKVKTTPGVGPGSACLDLVELQKSGIGIKTSGSASRISTDGFKLCKSAFTVKTEGEVDIAFIYDNSGSMEAVYAYINPIENDTIFYHSLEGCFNNTITGTLTFQQLTGPKTVNRVSSSTGCTGFSGDPYNARGEVIKQAIDYIAKTAPTSTAGATAFASGTQHEQPLLPMGVPANVQTVKGSIVLANEGGTLYRPPLVLVKRWMNDPTLLKTKKRAIVFISDGAPSDTVFNSYMDQVDSAMPPIYSIFLGKSNTQSTARLKDLSDRTKGTFTRVDAQTVSDIVLVMQDIIKSLLISYPPQSIEITNLSLTPPQVSKSTQILVNSDSSVSLVLDSILALKVGANNIEVKIITGTASKTFTFTVNADGPATGTSDTTLICYVQPGLVMLNPQGKQDAAYPSGPTQYTVRLTRASSDLKGVMVKAVSVDSTQTQPWGDAETILLPLVADSQGVATNRHDLYPFNGADNSPQANNGTLEAAPSGKVVLTWVHPRDPREFAVYELPGGGLTPPLLDLYHAGQKLSAVSFDQANLEIRVVFSAGDTCSPCTVEVLPSGSADRENVAVAAAGGYHGGSFIREMLPASVPGDSRLQHLAADSIILIYRNPRKPLEVVRRSYPFNPPPPIPPVLIVGRHGDVSHPGDFIPQAGKNWILVAPMDVAVVPGDPNDKCCGRLPWPLSKADSVRFLGVTVEATKPFNMDAKIFSNFGQFVSKVSFSINEAEFKKLPKGTTDSSRILKLLWDNESQDGAMAGTGAYVMKVKVQLATGELGRSDSYLVGMLRRRR